MEVLLSKKCFIFVGLLCISGTIISTLADRTSLKIYETIQSDLFCFRRLNSTHQIGCSSHRSGNIGIIYVIEDYEHLQNVTADPLYTPYIAAIPMELFNMGSMTLLKHAAGVTGVLILYEQNVTESKPNYFSPEQSCPNRNFGFYTETVNPKYASCQNVQWNFNKENLALGMMYEDWGMPIFIITNETSIGLIRKCYEHFNEPKNGVARKYPLCAAQLMSVMLAAKDSDTCMRRSKLVANLNQVKTCDPLSDKNIITTLFPTNKSEEVPEKSVVVVGCRLDSFSMFDRLAPGAHSTVTGLVTLLTVAHTLAGLKEEILQKMPSPQRNVLFAIFNGEAFDYIGSSRVVFDMQKGEFPFPLHDDIEEQPALLDLNHISHFIELSQLATDNSTYYVHTDPVSSKNETVSNEVTKLFNYLERAAEASQQIKIKLIDKQLLRPLPPASFQSFLRHKSDIPGIVVADHDKEFNNRYYNSMFDTNSTIDTSMLSQTLAALADATTKMLYEVLTDKKLDPSLVRVNESWVNELLECYLKNASCDLFRQIADPAMMERLRVEPYPLYISVHSGGPSKANAITLYTRYLLAYLTGNKLENRDRGNCSGDGKSQIYHYDWMTGPDVNSSGICVKSTVTYTLAESPAYVLDDWKSTEYSTWTESVWLETSVRIFLKPSRLQEAATFSIGVLIFLLSIFSVYFVNKRSSIIFNTKPLISCWEYATNHIALVDLAGGENRHFPPPADL